MADDRARVVIIGGGVAGTSIAYHLTRLGWNDVLLVDRGELTSGSTFHSAGLVAQLRNSVSHTRMMMYGAELYPTLADETGVDPGWHQVGTLHLASSPYRMEALARQAGWAKSFGLPVEIVSTEDALERFPLIDASGCSAPSSSRPTATSTRPGSRFASPPARRPPGLASGPASA